MKPVPRPTSLLLMFALALSTLAGCLTLAGCRSDDGPEQRRYQVFD